MIEKILTVSDLIKELEKYPKDLEVWTEGCDCFGSASSVRIDCFGTEEIVLIERN